MTRESAGFDNKVIIVAHGDCPADAEALAGKVRESFPAARVIVTDVGCSRSFTLPRTKRTGGCDARQK